MTRPSLYGIVLMFCTAIACTQEISINIPSSDRQIVVASILNPDSLVVVQLTYSRATTLDPIEFVNNGSIDLYEDGIFKERLSFLKEGRYVSAGLSHALHAYKIIVEVPGYETLEAEDFIPARVDDFEICFRKVSGESVSDVEADLNIANSSSQERLWVDLMVIDSTAEVYKQKVFYIESNSISLDNFNAIYDSYFKVFQYTLYVRQNDESLRSQQFSLLISGAGGISSFRYKKLSTMSARESLTILAYNCSPHYDKYLKSVLLEFNNSGITDIPNPLSAPVKVYTNVKGGLGIFAAFSTLAVRLEKFECK